MATTLGQLLDTVTGFPAEHPGDRLEALTDTLGALGHAGRALRRLAHDGLGPHLGSERDRLTADLGTACSDAAGLVGWPATGPLIDAVGAAADAAGRARSVMGRSSRWAAGVAFAAAADQLAERAHLLVPAPATPVLLWVRHVATGIEQAAWADPPPPDGLTFLDRLLPLSYLPPGSTGVQVAAEAVAVLVAAVEGADRRGGLTLREFRTVCLTAQVATEYAAAVPAAGRSPGWSAPVAWQVVRDGTAAYDDGRWGVHYNRTDVTAAGMAVAAALRREFGPAAAAAAGLASRGDLPQTVVGLQVVTGQVPVLADRLAAVAHSWAGTGALRAHAGDLPAMADMPEPLIREVLAGRRIPVPEAALQPTLVAVARAGRLSAALADQLNRADTGQPLPQPHLAAGYAAGLTSPGAGAGLLRDAHEAERALAAVRAPFGAATRDRDGPGRSR